MNMWEDTSKPQWYLDVFLNRVLNILKTELIIEH